MNPWEILGVPPGADRVTIRKAYFEKIASHSPDRDPEGFKQIRAAYEEMVGGGVIRSSGSTGELRRLEYHKEILPSPQELLRTEMELKDELTIQQLIRYTL